MSQGGKSFSTIPFYEDITGGKDQIPGKPGRFLKPSGFIIILQYFWKNRLPVKFYKLNPLPKAVSFFQALRKTDKI
jgi:hypothetical protein